MNARLGRAALVVLAALVGIWAGIGLQSSRKAGFASPAPPVRTAAGEASPPNPSDVAADFAAADSAAGHPIPDRLPSFSLADRAGKLTPITRWEGKSLVLNFWATWCAPCRREIPLLESLHSTWAGRGVEVVGIAVDYRDKVAAYADELKIGYPLLIGEQEALDVAAQFGVESPAFPFTVFTDRAGEVVALFMGELHQPQADLILGIVQDLNTSRVALPAARRAISDGLQALSDHGEG